MLACRCTTMYDIKPYDTRKNIPSHERPADDGSPFKGSSRLVRRIAELRRNGDASVATLFISYIVGY